MNLNACCCFREGIEWADIDWVDNGECLDLIEKVSERFITIIVTPQFS